MLVHTKKINSIKMLLIGRFFVLAKRHGRDDDAQMPTIWKKHMGTN
jgi:hypothetical protein